VSDRLVASASIIAAEFPSKCQDSSQMKPFKLKYVRKVIQTAQDLCIYCRQHWRPIL